MSSNPYAPPVTTESADLSTSALSEAPAGRFTRLASAMVDSFAMMAIYMPVMILTGFFARAQAQQVGFLEQFGMSLFAISILLVLNGYLLFTRGQTIGKFLTKIQIVDFDSGKLLPFLRVFALRYLWLLPLSLVVAIIPGTMDDQLITLVSLVDSLMIFRADRRCLHDYIAGSKVVLYQDNRARLA